MRKKFEFIRGLLLLSILLIISVFHCVVAADPLISIGFNGNWNSGGTAGADSGSVVELNSVFPDFGEGILSDSFDQTSGQFDELGGGVVFGDEITPTNVQIALSGLMSFTITGFININDPTLYGDTDHYGAVLFSALNSDGDNGISILINRWHGLSLVVNGQIEKDPYDDMAHHWLTNFADGDEEKWYFFAVTYDGTVDPGSDPFDVQNVVWYTGEVGGDLHHRPFGSFDGVLYQGAVESITNEVWLGNTADTAGRLGKSPGTVNDLEYLIDSAYPATFAGKLEGIKIFGSKVDASGVLTQSEIESVRASIISEVCGGYENPYPAADFTKNCVVDIFDLVELCSNWLVDIRP